MRDRLGNAWSPSAACHAQTVKTARSGPVNDSGSRLNTKFMSSTDTSLPLSEEAIFPWRSSTNITRDDAVPSLDD
jgi:hypothetical protein